MESAEKTTGFVYDERFLQHETEAGHPDSPKRLSSIFQKLKKYSWFARLKTVLPLPAGSEQLAAVHTEEYIERVRQACLHNEQTLGISDVSICPQSEQAARLAAGAALTLVDEIMTGVIQNGFGLVRPPGHHAEKGNAMGFCIFNNTAIAARYFQKKYGLERILILDWDVHHGNGTQHVFEEDPTVFYISLHQYPFYPGTGAASEEGEGRGRGTTLNCPMKAGAGDRDYREAFGSKISPAVQAFKPDAVIISAGFDAHRLDPLGNINLTAGSFSWMTEEALLWAAKYSKGRLLSLLEGGYHPAALAQCVQAHVKKLSGI